MSQNPDLVASVPFASSCAKGCKVVHLQVEVTEVVKRAYNLWVVIRPAESVPGEWVGHCLDFDLVTQGTSLRHAIDMMGEAIALTLTDDLIASRDPFTRRAPEEFWTDLYKLIRKGKKVENMSELLSGNDQKISTLVCQLQIELTVERASKERRKQKATEVKLSTGTKPKAPKWDLPVAWVRAGGSMAHA